MKKVYVLVKSGRMSVGHGDSSPYTTLASRGAYDTNRCPAFKSREDANAYLRMFDLKFEVLELPVIEFMHTE